MNNKLKLATIVAVLCVAGLNLRTGRGQQAPPPAADPREGMIGESMTGAYSVMLPPPLTKLEAFAAQKGVVITKGYTDLGTLTGDDASAVRVSAVQFSDGREKVSGVAVHVAQPRPGAEGGGTFECTAYVDEHELDGLIAAVDSLAKMQDGAAPLQQFDARYQTLGALELTNTNVNGGRVMLVRAMELPPAASDQRIIATAQFFVARLPELGQRLATAKDLLGKLKSQPQQ